MKLLLSLVASLGLAAGAVALVPVAFAQNSPGSPDGIIQDQFKLNPHPQMQFAASAPTDKFQRGTSRSRKRADNGDPNGCNLQCPKDAD